MTMQTRSVNSRTMTRRLAAFAMVAAVSALAAGTAWAKDSMDVTVTNATGAPVIVNNGQAVGTIQLFYTVNANAFTLGQFATFDLNWITSEGSGKATEYGTGQAFTLIQDQQGGYVDLVPSPDAFTLTATGQSGTSHVTIYITTDKAGHLPSTDDGTDLVGNLKLDAGSKVGTVTNIQVHIRLVHPTACLKVYNFVTDQDFNLGILNTSSLKVPTNGAKAGKVVSSQPGQFSDNVLIANTCATAHSFDLRIGLDASFSTNPSDNPGNAVVTYTAAGEFDTTTFSTLTTADGTAKGQNLCLQNVTVPAGTSFLATVHSKVRNDWPQTSLPADGSFDFAASVYQNVNAGCTGSVHSDATPNPATFTLPFTIK
jgi:hypothetical protein